MNEDDTPTPNKDHNQMNGSLNYIRQGSNYTLKSKYLEDYDEFESVKNFTFYLPHNNIEILCKV